MERILRLEVPSMDSWSNPSFSTSPGRSDHSSLPSARVLTNNLARNSPFPQWFPLKISILWAPQCPLTMNPHLSTLYLELGSSSILRSLFPYCDSSWVICFHHSNYCPAYIFLDFCGAWDSERTSFITGPWISHLGPEVHIWKGCIPAPGHYWGFTDEAGPWASALGGSPWKHSRVFMRYFHSWDSYCILQAPPESQMRKGWVRGLPCLSLRGYSL